MLGWAGSVSLKGELPAWLQGFSIIVNCALTGALGGVIYCLRAVYLNRSVQGQWNTDWNVWYYLRPLVSFLVGGVSYIFLKAGLLILDANTTEVQNQFGFLSLAFIAGLNVDKFLKKIEEVAQTTWGVDKSRASTRDEEDKEAK